MVHQCFVMAIRVRKKLASKQAENDHVEFHLACPHRPLRHRHTLRGTHFMKLPALEEKTYSSCCPLVGFLVSPPVV